MSFEWVDSIWLDLNDDGMLELNISSGKYLSFGQLIYVWMWAKKYAIWGFGSHSEWDKIEVNWYSHPMKLTEEIWI